MASATGKKTTRGFLVTCVCCGEEGNVRVNLDDASQFFCTSCDQDFDADAVRAVLAEWELVLAWCELAPARG